MTRSVKDITATSADAGNKKYRLRELDFLRGIAIILVLFRHQVLFDFTFTVGWIGVDLFFVLSGFLVSGLLFKEYIKYGNIKPGLFLIRRGFKIYPLYYLTYLVYLVPRIVFNNVEWNKVLIDWVFLQNYILGWGYAYIASWSLAVEEHFYFAFAVFMFWGIRKKIFRFGDAASKISRFEWTLIAVFILCFLGRLAYNFDLNPEDDFSATYTMTHFRIDSLMAGVFVGYQYYFRREAFSAFINKYKTILLLLALAFVSFAPFLTPKADPFFVNTYGFTLLYSGFAILLSYFLVNPNINRTLDQLFSTFVVNAVSKIGLASYSIYIIHTFVNFAVDSIERHFLSEPMHYVAVFFITSAISVGSGILMTDYVEKYFLRLRDKWYPSRVN